MQQKIENAATSITNIFDRLFNKQLQCGLFNNRGSLNARVQSNVPKPQAKQVNTPTHPSATTAYNAHKEAMAMNNRPVAVHSVPCPTASDNMARQKEQRHQREMAQKKMDQDRHASSKRRLNLLLSMDECKNGGRGGFIQPLSYGSTSGWHTNSSSYKPSSHGSNGGSSSVLRITVRPSNPTRR